MKNENAKIRMNLLAYQFIREDKAIKYMEDQEKLTRDLNAIRNKIKPKKI